MTNLKHPWDVYAAIQKQEDKICKIGPREKAGDEKLNRFLALIADGDVPQDSETVRKRLANLEVNRQSKFRNQQKILVQWADAQLYQAYFHQDFPAELESAEQLGVVCRETTLEEWRILYAIASGVRYRTVADVAGMSETSLRVKVSRLRAKLRSSMSH